LAWREAGTLIAAKLCPDFSLSGDINAWLRSSLCNDTLLEKVKCADMILSTLISNQSTATDSFAVTRQRYRGSLVDSTKPKADSCLFELDRVVREIESTEVREIVGTVFQDLLRLLECLTLIEGHLRRVDAAEETFALFQVIHDEARELLYYIRQDGLNCAGIAEDLSDTLDGIAFAVSHDLQRVFENAPQAPAPESSQIPEAHVVVGKLYRAHDVLTNCLQQSTISLAIMFDNELIGARLFNNSDRRFRQSLQLCQDLAALIQLVETAENECVEPALARLAARIEKFRNDSMECLMYSDWPQFESFCEQIKLNASETTELESVLHQFRCYLETLLGQVRMRAVLTDVFPIQFGADNVSQFRAPSDEAPALPSGSSDPEAEDANWENLALAG
jgi:hypothetical protein